ncbi:hypothetical protein SARC_07715, partial [Sphaeroforma arctica JP610]
IVVMYDQEIAPSHIRGKIGTAWQFSIVIGKLAGAVTIIFTRQCADGWRLSYGGVIPFALAMFAAFFYLPGRYLCLSTYLVAEYLSTW